jgi:transcription elongation factor GreA
MITTESKERSQGGLRRMTQSTLDSLLERKARLKEVLRELGASSEGDQRAAQHDDIATVQRKYEIESLLQLIGDLERVEIIKPREETSEIGLGNQVSLVWKGEEQPEIYLLLGPDDKAFGECSRVIVSYESPLGAAILGKRTGETATFILPDDGEFTVKIVAIKPGNF